MKRKILIFIDWFLPGYKAGGPVTSVANLVGHLKDYADYYIVTRNTDYCESEPYKDITPNCWHSYSENVSIYYFSQNELNTKNLKTVVEDINCDLWYITGVYSWFFSIFPVWQSRKKDIKKIVAPRGMLSSHALDVKSLKKKIFIKIVKLIGLYRSVVFHATNQDEADQIKYTFPKNEIFIASNLPKPDTKDQKVKISKKPNELRLCSISRIAREKNILGALQILSSFAEKTKAAENYSIQFDIYGHLYDNDYWEECVRVISNLPQQIKVQYHGSLAPELIPEAIKRSHFLFLPTHGENFGHSIIESLSLEIPVIISDKTPWTNLEKKMAGWDIPLGEPDQYMKVLQICLEMEQIKYDKMRESSLAVYQQEINIDASIDNYKKLFGL